MRRRESADAAANHNQIKTLASFDRLASFLPEIAVAYAVGNFKTPHMASTQAGQRGGIVPGSFLGLEILVKGRQQMEWKGCGPSCECYAIQKVAAGDAAIHSEFFVA